jgi:hypothetical protein
MPEVSNRLVEATLLLPEAKTRKIERVGVISTTLIAEEDLPPGIKRLADYISRPWSGTVPTFNIAITGVISETPEITDRCIHTLNRPEGEDELLTIQFDWQREFRTGWQNTKSNLERILDDATKEALKYFEELAEGSRFDEVLIREAALL